MNEDKFRPRIYIDKEGNWYQDGYQILHRRTYLYNNKLLDRDNHGRYYIEEGRGRVYAIVEDTPFVVKDINVDGSGAILITLNDETSELLDIDTLRMKNNTPYLKVKGGKFPARFNRPAYYRLAELIKSDGDGYYLKISGKKHRINIDE